MGFLAFSIVCSVLVSVLLKLARPNHINLAIAITINYAICSLLTFFMLKPALTAQTLAQGWPLFIALGVLLPSVFLIMGKAVEAAGIIKADTAQRLALIIPIIAAFVLFGESLNAAKITALVLVFVAMGCLLYKKAATDKTTIAKINNDPPISLLEKNQSGIYYLIGVFVGYGIIDILLKKLSKMGSSTASNLLASFILSGLFMMGYSLYKKYAWQKSSIIGGLLLGLLNFSNIYSYINAHKALSETPTVVFAGMNIGVIVLGMLTGLLIFKEKISAINAMGIVLAIIAIGRLYLFAA